MYGDGLDSKGKHVGSDVTNRTYYAKETKAPKGYKLDTTVYTFKDSGKKTVDGVSIYSFTCSDKPANDPIGVVLKNKMLKLDKQQQDLPERNLLSNITLALTRQKKN